MRTALVESPALAPYRALAISLVEKYISLACSRAIRFDFYGSDQVVGTKLDLGDAIEVLYGLYDRLRLTRRDGAMPRESASRIIRKYLVYSCTNTMIISCRRQR